MYYSVKYDIMKVDIIRFLILHKYGGLYADLDIFPKLKKLKDKDLIISYKKGQKREHFEMEVVQSKKNNKFLLDFLDHVKKQIKEKNKVKIYDTWKARYVYQTTGPYSLHRFLKENNIEPDKYIINEPKTDDNSLNLSVMKILLVIQVVLIYLSYNPIYIYILLLSYSFNFLLILENGFVLKKLSLLADNGEDDLILLYNVLLNQLILFLFRIITPKNKYNIFTVFRDIIYYIICKRFP